MRFKITSTWLPVLIALTGTLLFIISYRLQSEALLLSCLAVLVLMPFVYFPRLIYVIFKEDHPKKAAIINYIGLVAISLIVLTSIFRMGYMVGSGPISIIATLIFIFNFMPAWFMLKFKQLDGWGRLLLLIFSFYISVFVFYWQFKSLHWPGGSAFGFLTVYSFYYALVPTLILLWIFKRKSIGFKLTDSLLFGFIFAYLLSMYQTRTLSTNALSRESSGYDQVKKNLDIYTAKNAFLYESLFSARVNDGLFLQERRKAEQLQRLSDNICTYLKTSKTKLISVIDGISEQAADTTRFSQVIKKGEIDLTSKLLLGDNYDEPIQTEYSAFAIKKKLEAYSHKLDSLVPAEALVQFKSNKAINTADVYIEEDERGLEKWENHRFSKQTLGNVLTFITSLESDVRYTEQLALNEIFNKANANRRDNIAAQLAEIATKYETEKKEKQITVLQKDKEMSDMKIQAKNEEIARNEARFTLAVLILIVFTVLIVFVVRANLQRKRANKRLEEQNQLIAFQKEEVEKQKHLVEEKQMEILDSINYAKRIQYTLLAHAELLRENLPEHFVFFQPKDIVSGDFYWATKKGNRFFLAVCDSTGHGVPGAFMSLLNISFLSEAINEKDIGEPNEVFNFVRQRLVDAISREGQKDGFDGILLCLERNNGTSNITYAAANNSPVLVRGDELVELHCDKMPVGQGEKKDSFSSYSIKAKPGEMLYLYTDGYADQFGGPKGKKFKYKQLNDLILANARQPLELQESLLRETLHNWKGRLDQVDDVCVIGVRI